MFAVSGGQKRRVRLKQKETTLQRHPSNTTVILCNKTKFHFITGRLSNLMFRGNTPRIDLQVETTDKTHCMRKVTKVQSDFPR